MLTRTAFRHYEAINAAESRSLTSIAIMILAQLVHFVVIFKVAVVAIFPDVAGPRIEERVISAAVRELDAGDASLRLHGLGLKDWF
jgi:hypothetical protein